VFDIRSSAKNQARHYRPRAALVWGLVSFVGVQLALAWDMERWQPELRDAEFGYKLATLRKQMEKSPGAPLVLALGSSRTQLGFRPSVVSSVCTRGGESPVVFNFGLVGAGPVIELMCLQRLLDHGVRPCSVVVEILPPRFNEFLAAAEADSIDRNRLGWKDWPLLERYITPNVPTGYRRWLRSQFLPCFTHRLGILSYCAPHLLMPEDRLDRWRTTIDRNGWMAYSKTLTPEAYQHGLDYARREYAGGLLHFGISPRSDGALRELLALCRREQIGVVLVAMPEGTEFQSWYPPAARAEVDAYLERLRREEQVLLVDARSWVPDDYFADGHHLMPRGASLYTERLSREAIRTLLHDEFSLAARRVP
jgi:hypothetical protein